MKISDDYINRLAWKCRYVKSKGVPNCSTSNETYAIGKFDPKIGICPDCGSDVSYKGPEKALERKTRKGTTTPDGYKCTPCGAYYSVYSGTGYVYKNGCFHSGPDSGYGDDYHVALPDLKY